MAALPSADFGWGGPGLHEGSIVAGKYRCERVIGHGGMAFVVAATHLELGDTVALKFLRDSTLAEPGLDERFLQEARMAVRLKSEHVARVFDVGRLETGRPFIVMEFLEGRDLAATLRARGPLPANEAAGYVLQAAQALAEAHALGMIHRDVKPGNVFLARGAGGVCTVKVLDFGISTFAFSDEPAAETTVTGTPRYMSPEQIRSPGDVDARSDIWSLGVVLYVLVSGRQPFAATTPAETMQRVLHAPPRSLDDVDLPDALRAVLERCLKKERSERYASLADLSADLAPLAGVAGELAQYRIAQYMGLSAPAASTPSSISALVVRAASAQARLARPRRHRVWLPAVGVTTLVVLGLLARLSRPHEAALAPLPLPPPLLSASTPVIALPTASAAPSDAAARASLATTSTSAGSKDNRRIAPRHQATKPTRPSQREDEIPATRE